MYRDYRNQGVNFYYVYANVQHPEINNFVAPYSLKERLMHVAEVKKRTQSEIPWICDTMKNEIKLALGGAPNGELVIDPEGKIVRKRFWSNPKTLRGDLETLVGKVEKPTKVSDLPVVFKVEPRKIASGVVPKIKVPGGMTPLVVEPELSDEVPSYVKLRAEADRKLAGAGKGKLYLGFYLDPLYQVHWNNRMARLKVEIVKADGITVESHELLAPEVKEDADVDPRQFLVNVQMESKETPIELIVRYTACDDAETFCMPVEQRYKVWIKRDRYGGSRPGVFMPAMFANVLEFDKNRDGKLTKSELPQGRVSLYIGHMDFNHDDVIDASEIETFMKMFNNGQGFESSNNDGQGEDR